MAISDDATHDLVIAFYEELKKADVSKAEALRRAQRKLLADATFSHPSYWSPYLMISNWL